MCYYFQTLRRLAQNREAARKSRLRKKVGLSELLLLTYSVFTFTIKKNNGNCLNFCAGLCSAAGEQSAKANSTRTGTTEGTTTGLICLDE